MKIPSRFLLAVSVVAVCSSVHAQVTFTNVADTSGPFSNFGHFASADDGAPALNNAGVIATWAATDAGPQGFYRFPVGGGSTTIVDNSGTFIGFTTSADFAPRRAAINASGQVAFYANNGTRTGVFRGTGATTLTTIADTTTAFPGQPNPFGGFGQNPSLSNSGTVAFTGSSGPVSGAFTGAGGATSTIALSGTATSSGIVFGVGNYASINASGVVAVRGTTPDGIDFHRIWSGSGGVLTTVFNPTGPTFGNGFGQGNPSINASGNVAFHAFLESGETGIFRGNGGTPTTIVDSSGPFSSFGFDPSINSLDAVVFIGNLDAGGYGIFNGPNPVTNKVIAVGDSLFGSTVNALNIGPYALNDGGQIAFFYNLVDGRNGIAIATPVPEPSSMALGGTAICGLAFRAWRRRRTKSNRD